MCCFSLTIITTCSYSLVVTISSVIIILIIHILHNRMKKTATKATVELCPGEVMGAGFQVLIGLSEIHVPRMWVEEDEKGHHVSNERSKVNYILSSKVMFGANVIFLGQSGHTQHSLSLYISMYLSLSLSLSLSLWSNQLLIVPSFCTGSQ